MKKLYFLILLFFLGCTAIFQGVNQGGNPPSIYDSYAPSNILPSRILKVFLEAEDPDGDLKGFLIVASQLGVNPQSTNFLLLKEPKLKGHCKGFFTIDIPRLDETEFLKLEITAIDERGLKSNTVEKTVRIGFDIPEIIPSKWQSSEKIGHLFFEFLRDKVMEKSY